MYNPNNALPLPESEQNAPADRSIGFKPWDTTHDRYWMGRQWAETYRKVDEIMTEKNTETMLNKALLAAQGSYNSTHESPDQLELDQLRITWFSKVLNNWKALVSTTIPGGGLYFEVTYNGEPGKEETYVDTYRKEDNQVFSNHDN
jgi:hypothetical protein